MVEIKKYTTNKIKILDKFLEAVIRGDKKSTIRYGLVFITENPITLASRNRSEKVKITKVDYSKVYGDLTEEDAKADGFETLGELKETLKRFYPGISDNDPLTIFFFEEA